jgi:lauroyl/myristoyl acyltransferase
LRISDYWELKAMPIMSDAIPAQASVHSIKCANTMHRQLLVRPGGFDRRDTRNLIRQLHASHLILCMKQDADTKSTKALYDFFARHAHTPRVELQII